MKHEIEDSLREIGGEQLIKKWRREYDSTPENRLPTAYLEKMSLGYALSIGVIATSIDVVMDNVFRVTMEETHQEFTPEEQRKTEANAAAAVPKPDKEKIAELLKENGYEVSPHSIPDVVIDFYQGMNDDLGLKTPYKLRPKNHRILNHTDAHRAIDMLMRGEVSIGGRVFKAYPEMSEEVARQMYNLHIAADRHTPQSVPLKIMSWLWEQSVQSENPTKCDAPHVLFDLLNRHAPNIDWKPWIECFFGEDGIKAFMDNKGNWPEDLSLGDVMLKLYEAGFLNERIFWTSNIGAAVGGFKRRIVIASTMELGIEVFALVEGLSSGFVEWNSGNKKFISSYREWRDQPKYINMRALAQAAAAAGPAVRGLWTWDAFSHNGPSLAMMMRHLWVSPDVHRRHTDRLVAFSMRDSIAAIEDFESATGILINPPAKLLEGGRDVGQVLDRRLLNAGCVSTRIRVLASRYPDKMDTIVERIEKLAKAVEENENLEEPFDAICNTWYMADIREDTDALKELKNNILELEKRLDL